MERGTFLNIQNPSVLCRVSKGDQSHFEALGASFVCEGCEVLPKWLCQFFKTHLQLTLSASAFIVFGAQVCRHMIESGPLWRGSLTIKSRAFDSHICYSADIAKIRRLIYKKTLTAESNNSYGKKTQMCEILNVCRLWLQ